MNNGTKQAEASGKYTASIFLVKDGRNQRMDKGSPLKIAMASSGNPMHVFVVRTKVPQPYEKYGLVHSNSLGPMPFSIQSAAA
jgi:hypothetical protein